MKGGRWFSEQVGVNAGGAGGKRGGEEGRKGGGKKARKLEPSYNFHPKGENQPPGTPTTTTFFPAQEEVLIFDGRPQAAGSASSGV